MADYNNFDANQNNQNGYQAQPTDNYGQQFGYGAPVAPQEKKGQSIASLVLGICSFIAWIIPLFGYPVTIVGIIMGAVGMKKGGKGMAIAGIICSSIGLVVSLINSIAGAMMMMSLM